MKNSKGEGEKKKGGGALSLELEGLGGVLWVHKIGVKWPVIAMAITRKPVSLFVWDRELELKN